MHRREAVGARAIRGTRDTRDAQESGSGLPRATRSALVAGVALLALPALMALGLALLTPAGTALANGTPIQIVLSHLPGVSNWGPQNATGVAELITSEGEARVTAAGLEKLADADEYQVWIRTAEANSWMRLGVVAIAANGVGRMDTVLKQPIPEKAWELMQISVETKGAEPAAPGNRLTIAGRFSMANPSGVAPPKVLPNTGGDSPVTGVPTTGLLGLSGGGGVLLVLLVVGVVSFALGRAGARRGA